MNESTMPKRELILQAAREVFSEYGFHRAKIEEIALKAGIGKGTVYEYFDSKEHLFREMIKNGVEIFNCLLSQEMASKKKARDKLTAYITLSLEMGNRFRASSKISLIENTLIDKEFEAWLMEVHHQGYAVIEAIIKEGIKNKEIRPIDTFLWTRVFVGSISFLCSPFTAMEVKEQEIGSLVEEILSYYFRGLDV